MEAVLVCAIVFGSVIGVIKMSLDYKTRRSLIERGEVDNKLRSYLVGTSELSTLSNLKWGMVLVGVGLASFLSYYMPYRWEEEGTLGLILIFSGIAFLVYYPIAQRRMSALRDEIAQSGNANQ